MMNINPLKNSSNKGAKKKQGGEYEGEGEKVRRRRSIGRKRRRGGRIR
jgi:hypothetical protein